MKKIKVVMKGPVKVRVHRDVVHYIKEWRQHRGLSVEALGKQAGISGSMVSQLERGATTYTQATLEKLSEALDVQPWQLLVYGPEQFKELAHGDPCAPSLIWETLPQSAWPMLREILTNNCEAAVKSVVNLTTRKKPRSTVKTD